MKAKEVKVGQVWKFPASSRLNPFLAKPVYVVPLGKYWSDEFPDGWWQCAQFCFLSTMEMSGMPTRDFTDDELRENGQFEDYVCDGFAGDR